ncbi:glutamate synthase subunit beta [Propionispora hippei]|uniref:Glutamate synthase (NADPH/NADH) small chain n=1 Tax=Propionispora hippei DSM 15287 TaxID=1123003 RepID=A0A1M6LJ09_9FIRM|nr:glutamate synthase subunit beta [Propionispora hippei]SHJ71181.1 glutamate synthase (NADPH/NADH) small chain [Propionispora hippei DSM 15287]
MAKPTGFIEYERKIPADRPPLERIGDWNELHAGLPEEEQRIQGARCMDCGIPYCHSGLLISGAASGCPINNLIPEWNELIYRGLWKKALQRLLKTNNFPEFTGRVCPAPCEGSCTLGINEPMITIKVNECAIIDRAYEQGWIKPQPPTVRTGKQVAVVGSGPAGLACADQLNQAGHTVTVFERRDRPGGLLMYGIPNMKLDKQVVLRRTQQMSDEGISFRTGVEIGKTLPAAQLLQDFDAVVLCTGAAKPRDLNAPGRENQGIHFAVDFLRANTKSLLDSGLADGQFISARGKDVIVIGGGDTGTDCVGTSIRHGCKSVVQFEILPRPALERTTANPWPEWPKTLKTDYGQQEAIALFGHDPRAFAIMTKKIVGNADGQVKELHTVEVDWRKDDAGRFVPVEISGSEKIWPAQLVLIAMGFLGPEEHLLNQLSIEQDGRSNIKTPAGSFATNQAKVFSAGDARRGQSLVVWAIQEGRAAARECDKYLMGYTDLP